MSLIFYPHEDELNASNLDQKLEILLESSERYKAVILDTKAVDIIPSAANSMIPKKLAHAFNWENLAKLLKEIRELPESSPSSKVSKADRLNRLAGIYEVLRGAKMPKLEAVRLALVNEASQLKGGSQVA